MKPISCSPEKNRRKRSTHYFVTVRDLGKPERILVVSKLENRTSSEIGDLVSG